MAFSAWIFSGFFFILLVQKSYLDDFKFNYIFSDFLLEWSELFKSLNMSHFTSVKIVLSYILINNLILFVVFSFFQESDLFSFWFSVSSFHIGHFPFQFLNCFELFFFFSCITGEQLRYISYTTYWILYSIDYALCCLQCRFQGYC